MIGAETRANRAIGVYCTAHGEILDLRIDSADQCLLRCTTQRNSKQTMCAMVNAKAKRYAHAIMYVPIQVHVSINSDT